MLLLKALSGAFGRAARLEPLPAVAGDALLVAREHVLDVIRIEREVGDFVGQAVGVVGVAGKDQPRSGLPNEPAEVDVPLLQLREGLVREDEANA